MKIPIHSGFEQSKYTSINNYKQLVVEEGVTCNTSLIYTRKGGHVNFLSSSCSIYLQDIIICIHSYHFQGTHDFIYDLWFVVYQVCIPIKSIDYTS